MPGNMFIAVIKIPRHCGVQWALLHPVKILSVGSLEVKLDQ